MLRSLPPDVARDALLAALESAGIGCTVVVDRGGELERVYANEAAARIFGLDRAAMEQLPPMLPLAPEERTRLGAMRAEMKAGQGAISLETAIVREDGTRVPVHVGLAFVPLGDTRATFAFLRDLSSQAEIEAALRESEARFRSVAEACPDSITVVSGGRFTYANPAALRHMGITTAQELEAIDPHSLTPPDQLEATTEYVGRLSRGEDPPPMQLRTRYPDDREKVFEISMRVTALHGEPAVVSYTRDITERVALHAELTKRDRLASLGLLASGVAHELNNPLASLSMQARRLREDAERLQLPEEARTSVALVDEAATRMRTIIGDLLFMARPTEQVQAHIDVGQILASTVGLVRAGGVPLPVRLDLGPLPAVQGFASRLGQVFLNVLRNAADAVAGRPDGEIRVRGAVVDDAVTVVIEDNGPGIPAALLGRVAEPFFTTKPQGVGLGLWISQTLLAEQGGALEVRSTEGEGTTVTVRMPLGTSHAGGGI